MLAYVHNDLAFRTHVLQSLSIPTARSTFIPGCTVATCFHHGSRRRIFLDFREVGICPADLRGGHCCAPTILLASSSRPIGDPLQVCAMLDEMQLTSWASVCIFQPLIEDPSLLWELYGSLLTHSRLNLRGHPTLGASRDAKVRSAVQCKCDVVAALCGLNTEFPSISSAPHGLIRVALGLEKTFRRRQSGQTRSK